MSYDKVRRRADLVLHNSGSNEVQLLYLNIIEFTSHTGGSFLRAICHSTIPGGNFARTRPEARAALVRGQSQPVVITIFD